MISAVFASIQLNFWAQFLVNVTSAAIHTQHHPMVKNMAPYILSKSAGTLFVQLLANQTLHTELQVVTMHPGFVYGEDQRKFGITEGMLPFDQG